MALVPFPSASPGRHDDDDEDSRIQLTDADPLDDSGSRMSFLEHLDELRKRLIGSVVALVVGFVIAFFFVDRIQRFIFVPLFAALDGTKLMYTSGFEPFMLTMKIGGLAGLMLAVPFII